MSTFGKLVCRSPVASELWGQGGTLYPQVQDLYPMYPPSQRCGLCRNFKQMTLTTRLYKVRTNLYPPHTKTFRRACRSPVTTPVPYKVRDRESVAIVSCSFDISTSVGIFSRLFFSWNAGKSVKLVCEKRPPFENRTVYRNKETKIRPTW